MREAFIGTWERHAKQRFAGSCRAAEDDGAQTLIKRCLRRAVGNVPSPREAFFRRTLSRALPKSWGEIRVSAPAHGGFQARCSVPGSDQPNMLTAPANAEEPVPEPKPSCDRSCESVE